MECGLGNSIAKMWIEDRSLEHSTRMDTCARLALLTFCHEKLLP